MTRHDRLTTLISRFTLSVHPAPLERATLVVLADEDGSPCRALFQPRRAGFARDADTVLVAAAVDWGGISNPLVSALPELIEVDLTRDAETMALAMLIKAEMQAQRCGAASVVDRLGEVLVVRILRGPDRGWLDPARGARRPVGPAAEPRHRRHA